MANYADSVGKPASELISLVLTDIEMPEMDGYILTKKIKSDPRFAGIPVIMHSSLSGMSNQQLGKSVGVDEYVAKFEPQKLSEALARRILGENLPGAGIAGIIQERDMDMSDKKTCWKASMPARGSPVPTRWKSCCSRSGTRETFGINVFKVREVGRTPHITRTPNMPKGVEGLISLRGNVIPVLSLSSYLDLEGSTPGLGKSMMVADILKRTLGFPRARGRSHHPG